MLLLPEGYSVKHLISQMLRFLLPWLNISTSTSECAAELMNMSSLAYLEFLCSGFWDSLLLPWEYRDEGSSGFFTAMLLSTESHVSPYGTP